MIKFIFGFIFIILIFTGCEEEKKAPLYKKSSTQLAIEYLEKGRFYEDKNQNRKAMEYFKKSADLNNTTAIYTLGYNYFNGKTTLKDETKGLKYYLKCAQMNDKYCQYAYGREIYIKNNISQGLMWMKKSADNGYVRGMLALGNHYANRFNKTEFDISKAILWYEKAGYKNNVKAIMKLVDIYLQKYLYPQYYDMKKAKYWTQKAYNLGSKEAEKKWNRHRMWEK